MLQKEDSIESDLINKKKGEQIRRLQKEVEKRESREQEEETSSEEEELPEDLQFFFRAKESSRKERE